VGDAATAGDELVAGLPVAPAPTGASRSGSRSSWSSVSLSVRTRLERGDRLVIASDTEQVPPASDAAGVHGAFDPMSARTG